LEPAESEILHVLPFFEALLKRRGEPIDHDMRLEIAQRGAARFVDRTALLQIQGLLANLFYVRLRR
jgi:hypothetical protein